ncbi:MAG TPA: NUDIX domain-containing protein [Longimicrobium sp.]|nr:NUDIX domain-containing protein [Longimicrobium sp.]
MRPKVVCVFRRGDEILVGSHHDRVKEETFYGPPGGGIEFQEHAIDALRREMREELEAELADVEFLGVVENVFTHQGQPKHEIAFIYHARFADPSYYARDEIMGDECGEPYPVRWMPLPTSAPAARPSIPPDCTNCCAEALHCEAADPAVLSTQRALHDERRSPV